ILEGSMHESNSSLQEVVEASGHLIDSHIMEQIFDSVVEYGGRYEVEHFNIGKTNADPSRLRMRLETPTREQMEQLLTALLGLGCSPVDGGDAELKTVERDKCAPEDFYSTTNHRTLIRLDGKWVEVQNQRMDAMVAVHDGRVACRKL